MFLEKLDNIVPAVVPLAWRAGPFGERSAEYRVGLAIRLMLFRSFHRNSICSIVPDLYVAATPGSARENRRMCNLGLREAEIWAIAAHLFAKQLRGLHSLVSRPRETRTQASARTTRNE